MRFSLPIFVVLLACLFGGARAAEAASVAASYSTPTDVPVTANGYTAAGNTVDFTLNFAPPAGTELTVVQNTSVGFISGAFSNLAHGQIVPLTYHGVTYRFVANYYGGTGNDLVLSWADNRLVAWGLNDFQQLGDNTATNRTVPTPVILWDLTGKTVIALASGTRHTLALCSDGTVAAWGGNANGQLGDNSTTQHSVPVMVNTQSGVSALYGKTVVAIAAGAFHSLALCSDGTVAAWGENVYGQLGNNSSQQSNAPVAVSTATALFGKTVVGISAGERHSLARCSDGSVVGWGRNDFGQLGDGTSIQRQLPAAVNTANGTSALFSKTVASISAGYFHSVAVCTDGTMVAWGQDNYGQAGDATTNPARYSPVAVNRASGVSALFGKTVIAASAGENFSVALCSDGTIAAWGSDGFGELGDNSSVTRTAPVAVNTTGSGSALLGKMPLSIIAGRNHAVARASDLSAAWGQNAYGQLGDSSLANRHLPTPVLGSALASGERFLRVFSNATSSHSVGIEAIAVTPAATTLAAQAAPTTATLAGTVNARGNSTSVFFEYGTSAQYGMTAAANPASLSDTADTAVSAVLTNLIPATTYHYRVGATNLTGTTSGADLTFTTSSDLVAGFNSAADVSATAASWNVNGATVSLSLNFAPAPGTELMVLQNTGLGFITGNFSNLAQGDLVTLSYQGVPYTFVANYYGGTGNDLVLTWGGRRLLGWGSNLAGQLGDGSFISHGLPAPVTDTGILAGRTILSLAVGGSHTLALCADGTVAAWGENTSGQLGDGSVTRRTVPVVVNNTTALAGKRVIAIAAGLNHSLALCSDGTVAAWGANASGQLGTPAGTQNSVPIAVVTDTSSALVGKSVVAIAAGQNHSLALCSDGSIAAWGLNTNGQLGNNSTTSSSEPVAVNTDVSVSAFAGRTAVALAGGGAHSLALCSDGTIVAWGSNGSSQLGDGTAVQRIVPIKVSQTDGLNGGTVVAIAAGSLHSMALCTNGIVVAWGNDTSGQLGDQSTVTRPYPQNVNAASGLSALFGKTVVSISAGATHSLAQCSDGTAAAWGANNAGQLGENSYLTQTVPVPISAAALAPGERSVRVLSNSGASFSIALVASPATAPIASTGAATKLTSSVVTLNATVSSAGAATAVVYQYSTDATFTSGVFTTSPALSLPYNANGPVPMPVTGLAAHTTYYFRVRATNYLGTTNGATLSFTTLNTAPTAPNQTVTGTTGDRQTVTIAFPVQDADGDAVTITQAFGSPNLTVNGITATTVTFTPSASKIGNATFGYTVDDGHGGLAVGTVTVTVTDNDEPQTTLTLSPASITRSTSAHFVFNGSDNIGVAGFEASLDHGPYTPAISPLNLNGLAEGTHNLRVRALDASGNADSAPATADWIVDLTPPAITFISGNLTIEAAGPAGTVVDYLPVTVADAVTATPTVVYSKFTGTLFPVGSTTVTVTVTDEAGNQSAGAFTVNVRDSTGPAVAAHANVTAEATSAAGAKVAYAPATATDALTGSPAIAYSSASGDQFPLGVTTVTITATDDAGNTGTGSFTVTVVDTTKPVVAAHARVTAEATSMAGATVTYAPGTATDTVSAAPVITYSKLSGTVFPIGVTTVTIMATDEAGNTGTGTFNVTVNGSNVDKKAPVVAITAPTAGTVKGAFTLTGTLNENVMLKSFRVTRNGVPMALDAPLIFVANQQLTWSVSGITPENGTETFAVEAVDFAGRIGTATKAITFTNTRPELVGTCTALLVPAGARDLHTTGLVSVTTMASGAFSGKFCLSNSVVTFKGVLRNDGTARFLPALTPQLDLLDKSGYLGALAFSISAPDGMAGTLSTQAGGSALATFAGRPALRVPGLVAPALLNFPAAAVVPGKGVYTVVFPTGTSTAGADPVTWPQGDGFATLTVMKSGMVTLAGYLADGTHYLASGTLRTDGTVPLFTPLYNKLGVFSGGLAFADLPDSDVSGTDFAWFRPVTSTGNTFRAGWPDGLEIAPVGARYAPPAAFDFGQGIADVVSGNSSLVFTDGLLGDTLSSPVSLDPATGAVKPIRPATTPGTLTLTPASGLFSGTFTHGGVTDKYSGILLHKGANRGGFGYFLTTPRIVGAGVQSGGVSLQPRQGE